MNDHDLFGMGSGPGLLGRGADNAGLRATYDYVCSLARLDIGDVEAVDAIEAHAGGDRRILTVLAESLAGSDCIRNDPLLAHVAALAEAARSGTAAQPQSIAARVVAAEERRLLNGTLAEAFEGLCAHAPELRLVLETVTAPGWAERRRAPLRRPSLAMRLLDRVVARLPSEEAERFGGPGRTGRLSERAAFDDANAPVMRALAALLQPVRRDSPDPLLRTDVAGQICFRYLAEISGAAPRP